MPIYEYRCKSCGEVFEKMVRWSEAPPHLAHRAAPVQGLAAADPAGALVEQVSHRPCAGQ